MERLKSSDFGPAPPSRPRRASLSLSTLPPEIKSMIVDKIAEGQYVEEGGIPPMRAMSAVNREFAGLAEPYLWGHIDLEKYVAHHLPHILANVLPRHAHHVEHLHIPTFYSYNDYVQWSSDSDSDEPGTEALVAARIVAVDKPVVVKEPLNVLLTRAVGGMTRLSSVRCDMNQLADPFEKVWSVGEGEPWTGRGMPTGARDGSIALALVTLGPRLVKLELTGHTVWADDDYADQREFECTEGRLASFLSNFPSLSRLFLKSAIRAAGRDSRVSTLTSFHHLRSLELTFTDLLPDAFASAPWICPLEVLSLTGNGLPIHSLFKLLANFSATLKSFTHVECSLDPLPPTFPPIPPLPSTAFPLPHLHTLDIWITTVDSVRLLPAFASSPIEYLNIHDSSIVSSTAWLDLLHSHVRTLKRVKVEIHYDERETEVQPPRWRSEGPCRVLCDANGIECEVPQRRF